MMKDVVRVVLTLYGLEEWIEFSLAVVELRPVGVREHIAVRVVDVAALSSLGRVHVGLTSIGR
jgi:hypothetical protein